MAEAAIEHCRKIATFSDEAGVTTRTFLSPAMRDCLNYFLEWAKRLDMSDAGVDAAGNFRAVLPGSGTKRLIIGSHLDSVPNAGAFDGVLGVVMAMALAELQSHRRANVTLEVVGFSEEEGVRFGRPFIGSKALVSGLDTDFLGLLDANATTVAQAIAGFGLDPADAARPLLGEGSAFLEFHIEQGPVLESLKLPIAVVDSIAGQTRALIDFTGQANHAGTTPMNLRSDAFCAAAEWCVYVEKMAQNCAGLVATVGRIQVSPGAINVIPGYAGMTLDLRHGRDCVRLEKLDEAMKEGCEISMRRGLHFVYKVTLDQPAVPMNDELVMRAEKAVESTGVVPYRMTSGAGHDAMIMATRLPSAMIFLRSPKGISHHPDEDVLVEDIGLALEAGKSFIDNFV